MIVKPIYLGLHTLTEPSICCHSYLELALRSTLISIYFSSSRGGGFLQNILFHWLAFHTLLVSSLWTNPTAFWGFYLPKLTIALFIASGIFLFRRKYWTIVVTILIDLWIVAELIYLRSTHLLLDVYSIGLINNLKGFESSLLLYVTPDLLLLLIPLIVVVTAVWLFDNRERKPSTLLFILPLTIVLNIFGANLCCKAFVYSNQFCLSYLSPRFIHAFKHELNTNYPSCTSVIHAFIYNTKRLIEMPFEKKYQMTAEEQLSITPFLHIPDTTQTPKNSLILVIVESLENWAIQPDITPNLYRFIYTHNVLWAQDMHTQTRAGSSGDGQLIINTGLLPIQEGVVTELYAHNTFPALSALFPKATMIQAGAITIWNQAYMNVAYGIDTAYLSPQSIDYTTFKIADSIITQYDFIMPITMATHSPFTRFAHLSSLSLPDDMPTPMRNYLRCLHYTDSCWGPLLKRIVTDPALQNTAIAFVGDHIIFDSNRRHEFQSYVDRKGLTLQPQEPYTAFILYTPTRTKRQIISETTYQMDVYPTLLHALGAENYYWKGFGINLADTTAYHHRPITAQEAFLLSDKIIRSDYFKNNIK